MLNVKYNVPVRARRGRSKYDQEMALVHAFNGSDRNNICFEYASVRESHNAAQSILKYIRHIRANLIVRRVGATVVVYRKGDE